MTMSEALAATAGLFGLGFRAGPPAESTPEAAWFDPDLRQEVSPPIPEPLCPGDPCYEAVADALKQAGYLHS